MDQAIYESNIFDHVGQRWNFSFGHNNADGYGTMIFLCNNSAIFQHNQNFNISMIGYILCLHDPQIEFLQLQCTFNMFKTSGCPYSKTRDEPYIFGVNSMNSRGFVK